MAMTIDDSAKTPDKRQGTGFTNLQNMMNANQNNKLGQAVSSGVTNQFNQAQGSLNQAQNQFNTDFSNAQNTFNNNQQTTQNVLGNMSQGNDPNAISDDTVNTFQNVLGGQYGGPTGLNNQDYIQAKASSAQQLGQLGSTEGGKVELLKRFAGGPQYTQGQSALDAALLGQSGNAALNDIRRQSANLGSQAAQDIAGAQAQGQQLQGQTSQLAQDTKDAIQNQYLGLMGNAQTGDKGTIQTQLDAINAQRAQALTDAQNALNNSGFNIQGVTGNVLGAPETTFGTQNVGVGGKYHLADQNDYNNQYGVKVNQDILNQLGIATGQSLYGANISDLISADPTQGNKINAATQQQANQLLGLSKLAGTYLDPSEAAQIAQYNGNTDIGTFGNAPTIQMTDAAKAVAANRVAAAQQQAQNEYNQAKNLQTNILFNRDPVTGQTANYNVGDKVAQLLNDYYARLGNQIVANTPENNSNNIDTTNQNKVGVGSL